MNIFTHNGRITVESPSSEHRTFQIKTQGDDSTFAPGERILSLLTGPNNQMDYTGFAFVKSDRVILWKKHRTDQMKGYVKLLLHPEHYEQLGVTYHYEGRCRVCNRPLTNPESIESGVGPVCAGR